jgi:hypothetical protein
VLRAPMADANGYRRFIQRNSNSTLSGIKLFTFKQQMTA